MSWTPQKIEKSGDFKKSLKGTKMKEDEESLLVESICLWLSSKNDLLRNTVSNKLLYQKNGRYIFTVKIPSPTRKRGKSGGFRLIMLYDTVQGFAEIGKIFKRSDLDYKGGGGKHHLEYDNYITYLRNVIG